MHQSMPYGMVHVVFPLSMNNGTVDISAERLNAGKQSYDFYRFGPSALVRSYHHASMHLDQSHNVLTAFMSFSDQSNQTNPVYGRFEVA